MKKAMKKAAPKKAAMVKKPMPPARPEGSATAQMMMKFGGKTGKKKGMNKG